MIRVLIADDHPLIRRGLRQVIEETTDMVVDGEAANGQEVFDRLAERNFDVVLMDISMPGQSGLEIMKQVKRERPKQAFLILSIHPEEQYALRAFKQGASGYLTKDSEQEILLEAIRKIAKGRKYVTPKLAVKLAENLMGNSSRPIHETLSNREYEIMCMTASGLQPKEIAETLRVSVKTVNTYRSRIREKLGFENMAQVMNYAIKHGLVKF